jgi:2-succinyl-5-enolpyruvyl-6-hydroxy-3-cyclohexene-1-carboxylate synthase
MQAVYNIAEICAQHGITDVVLSPGSRSAPLTLAFARHPAFRGRLRVVPDERAAAFIGLGIAQATRRTVVLVCTSGTAGLNYAPAVAEAFFQQVPLLVLTADRPPEWIDQLDGQTIRQRNLYGAHAKGSFDFPADTSHADAKWHSERIINEAINLTMAAPAGPVQVNVPLREPFYPKAGEEMGYEEVKIIRETKSINIPDVNDLKELADEFIKADRVLFVFGQQSAHSTGLFNDESFKGTQWDPYTTPGMVVVGDVISNLSSWVLTADHWKICDSHDIFLAGLGEDEKQKLQPDLVISCGLSLISKALKQFLRAYPPKQHWHLQPVGEVADTFRSLTRVIRVDPSRFLTAMMESKHSLEWDLDKTEDARNNYEEIWRTHQRRAELFLGNNTSFWSRKTHSFNEFSAFRIISASLPSNTALHLANSMAVRYANILGIPAGRTIEVFANRGASGIDGCTSTAVGAALAQPERPVVLLTGDVAFFYDRNAFWHNYPTPNLRVVLFNNHGGGIFRLIDGPRQQPELDEFFETHQALTAENTARDFKLRYFPVSSFAELDAALPTFFAAETGAAILEIFTDSKTNAAFFEEYRKAVKTAFS